MNNKPESTPTPDSQKEDAQLEALSNALISSFLGSLASESDMSAAAVAMEYLLNCFITGPRPPFKSWFINTLSYCPGVMMIVTILTHGGVEHKLVLRIGNIRLEVANDDTVQEDEEGSGEDED